MSYTNIINNPNFQPLIDSLCFVEYYKVLREAISSAQLSVIKYLIEIKQIEANASHLVDALKLPMGTQNDEIIQYFFKKDYLTTKSMDIASDSQIVRLMESQTFYDHDGCFTSRLLDKKRVCAKIVSKTIDTRNQAMIKRLLKKSIAAGSEFDEVSQQLQNMIIRTSDKKSALTVDQLMIFLNEKKMQNHIQMLEESLYMYKQQ